MLKSVFRELVKITKIKIFVLENGEIKMINLTLKSEIM